MEKKNETDWYFALLPGLLPTAGLIRADQVDVSQLTLVGFAEADGVTYASLFDAANGEHFLTSSKDSDDGHELGAAEQVIALN